MITKARHKIEKYGFGVCQYVGDKMGIPSSIIRRYFIYTSFIAVGSPLIAYLFMAFWLNIKKYITQRGNLLLD